MTENKFEANIIIVINAIKKVIEVFLGPFLTAFFIKTSKECIVDLSKYYIFSYALLAIGTFIVANIIKKNFKLGMFRIGIVLNYIYILFIIILREKMVNHLALISILSGLSASAYWFPYNLFLTTKIRNNERTDYMVKSKIVASLTSMICPILLGSIITITNYELTAIIILFMSGIQMLLSFFIKDEGDKNLSKFNLISNFKKIIKNKQIKEVLTVEFFIGMNINHGALEVLMTILIFNSFKTNMNLGIITSITTFLSIIAIKLYGKIYKNRNDKKIIILSGIIPVLALLIVLISKNSITVVIYNACYVIFTSILTIVREIRIFNISNSYLVNHNKQSEFFAIREGILNCGRIVGYALLLFAGLSQNQIILNIVMVILTMSILIMGFNISKIRKFEK